MLALDHPDDFQDKRPFIPVPSLPWLQRIIDPGFMRGGVYLFAGDAEIMDSPLITGVVWALAMQGAKVLSITGQTGSLRWGWVYMQPEEAFWENCLSRLKGTNGSMDEYIWDTGLLIPINIIIPALFKGRDISQVLISHANQSFERMPNVRVLVIDGFPCRGLSASAPGVYRNLLALLAKARARGLVTILMGRISKAARLTTPEDLEQVADCIVHFRKALRLRSLFVPKNRFGPVTKEPILVNTDYQGSLLDSAPRTPPLGPIFGFTGTDGDLTQCRVHVSVPSDDSGSVIRAPFLLPEKVRLLLAVFNCLASVDLTGLSYEMECKIPGRQPYREELDLPSVVAAISSYLRAGVPDGTLFVGGLDHSGDIQTPRKPYLEALGQLLMGPQRGKIRKVYLSAECSKALSMWRSSRSGPQVCEVLDVCGVEDVEALTRKLWRSFKEPTLPKWLY